jgi:hypothetical protein
MPDLIESQLREIAQRLDELRPVVAEYQRLEAAAKALGSLPGAPRGASKAPRRPAQPARGRRLRGRQPGSGARSLEAHAIVTAQPGITISEIAAKMRIQGNYLYRVMPQLQKAGKVSKKGSGWHPT